MRKLQLLMVLFAVLFLLSACAPKQELPRFVWPPPPEEARLEWKGVYYSQDDLKDEAGQSAMDSFLGASNVGRFLTPIGIVSDGAGRVYISDVHKKGVQIYDFNQGTVGNLSPVSGFSTPLGLAIDSQKRIYVAEGARKQVFVFDKNNTPLFAFGRDDFKKPAYLAINESLGRIYVSDSLRHEIVVFNMAGKFLFSFGGLGHAEGEFYAPQGLAFSPAGDLFVADMFNARIQVFDSSGAFKYSFGKRGDQGGGFEQPRDVAFDSEGHLYVVDGRRSIVSLFTQKGELLLLLGEGKPSVSQFAFSAPRSIYIDQQDQIYVSEALGRRFAVWQFMDKRFRQAHPFTQQDKMQLIEYMEKVQRGEL